MTGVRLGKTLVRVWRGDLTELAVDAIVNAANNRLVMGGGVAGAIRRKGGSVIEEEAVRKGPIAIGEAVVTGAGSLAAKHVIHAATMGMDFQTDEKKIRDATANSLLRAKELSLKSIAFPALGTGVGGFPLDRAAAVMFEEVRKHVAAGTTLEEVVFALYGADAYDAFSRELATLRDSPSC